MLVRTAPSHGRACRIATKQNLAAAAIGWADVTLLVRVALDCGRMHIAELQLQLTDLAAARTKVHHHYSMIREILPAHGVESSDLDLVQGTIVSIMEG